jgi:hypothetical protein
VHGWWNVTVYAKKQPLAGLLCVSWTTRGLTIKRRNGVSVRANRLVVPITVEATESPQHLMVQLAA